MLRILIFTLMLCILPIEVIGRSRKSDRIHLSSTSSPGDDGQENYRPESTAQAYQEGSTRQTTSVNYTLPWPATKSIQPAVIFQGMNVTSVIPIYETCNLPGASTTSCSPSFQTLITTKCSTVLTGYFTRHTVSECDEIVTFSTQYGYSLATTTASASRVTHLHRRSKGMLVTQKNVHNITTYYAAPWQSIAADDPSDIHVTICGLSSDGVLVCTTVSEVWVTHTEYLPVYNTEVISVSTVVSSTGVLAFASDIYITITPGTLILSTQIVSTSLSVKNVTSTSTIGSMSSGLADLGSSVEDSTTTIYITGPATTTTINLGLVSSLTSIAQLKTRTTTITSTKKITRTTTFTPRRTIFRTT
ncbi:f317ebfe-814f-4843-bafe-b81e8784d101 [Sclerotinia trifoliorum]|uniref:F317ebfe-814f-4843-bafe-b81e8784d101 n=1 Tax=Sclerotinia trifoliorum TaxID=28548 RepID=A0A8H2W1Q3_9HELO|nr:f317ebfe-814f-4843-bafe-b81e8784d101 [Sclerotinia trifoliorum]